MTEGDAPRTTTLSVGVLGPMSLHVDGAPVEVPGTRRRALLAVLALAGGRTVGTQRLVDALWPDDLPDDAVQALYNHVSRLRGQLGAAGARLTRQGAGYALELSEDEVDARRARRLVDEITRRPAPEVIGLARDALALWRGPALEEFRDHPDLTAQAVSLDELRLQLNDDLTQARLDAGETGVVGDAAAIAADHPLRERSALLLMRALAQEGRPAEAMSVGTAFRRRLAEETGLDPGPAFHALEEQVASGAMAPSTGPTHSAALRTLARPSGPLVGRERDREEVRRLLEGQRVVTLTGPGGVGKTRLALEVAAEVAEDTGVDAAVVDLAVVDDAVRVPRAVASMLNLRTAEVTALDVARALADVPLLLVLDNCEHVADACRELVDTLVGLVPGVRVLSTSRITLHSSNEYVVRLQPLPVPTGEQDTDSLERQPSVQAFVAHARRRDRTFALEPADFEPLVDVLRHLDGLPLAIEIAAGHATTLPVATVRDRLALDLAAEGGRSDDDRQRTLRATIRWSYDMLTPTEQALLRACASFPGGVDLGTVEALAAAAAPGEDPVRLLQRLVDASLVDVDPGRTRYRLLFTVRNFLLQEVGASGEEDSAQARFVSWAHRAAAEIGAGLVGADEARADQRLRNELDNLRAARDLARARGDLDAYVDIPLALDQPSIWRDVRELWAWCLEMADDPLVADHPRRVEILGAAAESARLTGAFDRAIELAGRGLALAPDRGPGRARCESAIAAVAHYRGDFDAAVEGWALAGRDPGPSGSGLLASAALAAAYAGDRVRAQTLLAEAFALDADGHCAGNHAFALYVSGELAASEDPAAAVPAYEAAIEEARGVGATFVEGVASVALASVRTRVGDRATAAAAFAELLDTWVTTGRAPQLWTTARNAASLLLAEGHTREAALLLLRAEATPEAAAVDEDIARHSGRDYVAVEELLDPSELARVRLEAVSLSQAEVIERARGALLSIAAPGRGLGD